MPNRTTRVPLRRQIPTVQVRLATDDGEVAFRARWDRRAIDLQRRILFLMRQGKTLWFEDERGHSIGFKPECVWAAMVDGRAVSVPFDQDGRSLR